MSKTRYAKLEEGDVIGRLEVLGYSHTDSGNNRWMKVLCHCGKEFVAAAWRIKSQHTKSCGCLIGLACAARNVSVPFKTRKKRAQKGRKTRKINEKVNDAVLKEREECAKIAETLVGDYDQRWREHNNPTPRQIAEAIRNR